MHVCIPLVSPAPIPQFLPSKFPPVASRGSRAVGDVVRPWVASRGLRCVGQLQQDDRSFCEEVSKRLHMC